MNVIRTLHSCRPSKEPLVALELQSNLLRFLVVPVERVSQVLTSLTESEPLPALHALHIGAELSGERD